MVDWKDTRKVAKEMSPLPERTWVSIYCEHISVTWPIDVDRIEQLVTQEAEAIERSIRGISRVERISPARVGPPSQVVALLHIIPRDADKDIVERACSEADYRLREQIYKEADA